MESVWVWEQPRTQGCSSEAQYQLWSRSSTWWELQLWNEFAVETTEYRVQGLLYYYYSAFQVKLKQNLNKFAHSWWIRGASLTSRTLECTGDLLGRWMPWNMKSWMQSFSMVWNNKSNDKQTSHRPCALAGKNGIPFFRRESLGYSVRAVTICPHLSLFLQFQYKEHT